MSALLRKRRGGTPTESSSVKKQRFIDATKTLLDIAKESSDALPPLKSCLGFISALIKNYDEYNDVKEKLNDLVPWLQKLLINLAQANPNDNDEEVERRSQLAKSLEEVGERAVELSEKKMRSRILDKTKDSAEVVTLIEKLRRAILVYQVSQQQSIYNQVSQMTASFEGLLKLNQQTPVKKKVDSVRARLDRLKVEEIPMRNADESKRRTRLFEALEDIKDRLQDLSERGSVAGKPVEDEGDTVAVCDLADELRDVIVEYQFSQQKAIYDQNCTLIDAAELSVLNKCTRATGVEFRHGSRSGCLKGTRNAVLDEIESWSKDPKASPVYWLNGLAGTGKSTIAQTVAERIFADGRLGASFFCSRDFKDHKNLHYIFPTIAFQLAHKYPKFRSILVPLLQSNPDVAHESLYSQMESLIVKPLSSSDISTVIIIDALDECVDEDAQSAILSVMGRLVEEIPNAKFLITGRPEPRIKSGFRLELLRPLTDVFILHDVDPSIVNADIRLFLEHGLHELAERYEIERDSWPTEEHIDLLCERAAGLFVYAVATLKFLDHSFNPPNEQLNIIMKTPWSTANEGQANLRHGTTLDSLYLSTLQAAFSRPSVDNDEKVRLMIGTVVLAVDPLPPSAIAILVNLGKYQVVKLLQLIHSLLKLPEDPDSPVVPFHKSFPDFVIDPLRCSNKRFYIPPNIGHLNLALGCLQLMNITLEKNLLLLPDYSLNSEVQDLEGRISNHISHSLQYACKSWYNHITEIRGDITGIIPVLQNFLQKGFLAWLEVLSVTGAASDSVLALEKLIPWLHEIVGDHQLLHTARDYFHFVTNFFELINVSATHIYHSALELSPMKSVVRKFYYNQRPHSSPRVVIGTSDSWKSSTAVSAKHSQYLSSTWSPCGQFVAVVAEKAVEVWDALTLKLLTAMQSPTAATSFKHGIAYSPDRLSLAGCSNDAIIIWDTQTGGMVKEIKCRDTHNGLELVWSLDGETIAAISKEKQGTYHLTLYNVTLGTTLSFNMLQSWRGPHIWAYSKCFQISTTTQDPEGCIINIFDIGVTLTMNKSFTLQHGFSPGPFSPTTYRICLSAYQGRNSEYIIFDIHTSKSILQITGPYKNPCFSPDGTLFSASTNKCLFIWRYTSSGYIKWTELEQSPFRPQFSPNLLSIFGHAGAVLYILHLDYAPTTPVIEPTITAKGQPLDAFSPYGTFIVTTHNQQNTIAVTNLNSPNPFPSQFIDTEDLEISEIALTGNVLLVNSSDTVVGWLLTEDGVDGILGNSRADQNDSLWKVSPQNMHPILLARLQQQRHGNYLEFAVKDEVAAIRYMGVIIHTYHIGTGEVISSTNALQFSIQPWYRFNHPMNRRDCNLYHRQSNKLLESDWPISHTTLQKGWVKDPEGNHRLWLYPHWRSVGNEVDWLNRVTTLRLRNSTELVFIKF